jgi:hypothetical protein
VVYVIDTSSFIVLENYYPDTFPSFWGAWNGLADVGRVISVEEVQRELDTQATADFLFDWVDGRKAIFGPPLTAEGQAVADIFAVPHFQQMISQKQRAKNSPVADPWVIARARLSGACVVTEEALKPNASKIPNVCAHFGVECANLREVFRREGWRY